jgi:hypothetical protein
MREMGPVTYPAYAGTSAGIRSRSLTDEVLNARALEPEETSDENERAPAELEEATPARRLVRFGDRFLMVGPNGTPGAQSTSRDDNNNETEGDADA